MIASCVAGAIGFITGVLLAFGALVALFDWAHQGTNTRTWQILVGGVIPILTVVVALTVLRNTTQRDRQRHIFLASLGIGIVLGFVSLWSLLVNA